MSAIDSTQIDGVQADPAQPDLTQAGISLVQAHALLERTRQIPPEQMSVADLTARLHALNVVMAANRGPAPRWSSEDLSGVRISPPGKG